MRAKKTSGYGIGPVDPQPMDHGWAHRIFVERAWLRGLGACGRIGGEDRCGLPSLPSGG